MISPVLSFMPKSIIPPRALDIATISAAILSWLGKRSLNCTVLVSPHFIMSCNSLLFIFLGLFVNPVQMYGKKVREAL